MNSKLKLPNIVTLAILTTFAVCFWVAYVIYSSFHSDAEVDIPSEVSAPLSPTLDSEALRLLDETILLTEEEIGEVELAEPVSDEQPTPVEATEEEDVIVEEFPAGEEGAPSQEEINEQ